jgi:hypothetical protein
MLGCGQICNKEEVHVDALGAAYKEVGNAYELCVRQAGSNDTFLVSQRYLLSLLEKKEGISTLEEVADSR